jgi:N,N-dimethylformamidase beta subunit-like protein
MVATIAMRRGAVGVAMVAAVAAVALQPWRDAHGHVPRQVLATPQPPASHPPSKFSIRSPSPITIENRRPGTRTWMLDRPSGRDVEGFAAPASVRAGDTVRLYVRTPARSVRADLFRLGWYGGKGARLIARLGAAPGDPQTPCRVRGTRFTIACSWRETFRVATARNWVSGEYLVKLSDANGSEAYIPFTVLERSPRAPLLFVSAVTTWQAYNLWGGRSLYRGPHTAPCDVCATRSRAVSFDRPYRWPGAGNLFRGEFQTIELVESHGIDVGYATSIDLHERTIALEHRRAFLSTGHDEYYSRAMRSALESALSGGTSLAFLGANDIYRHIRFEPSPLGPDRIEVNYKIVGEDPYLHTNPADSTGNWRNRPVYDPEQQLLGAQYDCCPGANHCPIHVFGWTPSDRPAWLFEGTGLRAGVEVPRLIQGEYDRVYPAVPQPPGVVLVAHSPLACGSHQMEQDSTFYVAPSGGGVFDVGDEYFACALGPTAFGRCADRRADPRIERLAWNLFEAMLHRRFV